MIDSVVRPDSQELMSKSPINLLRGWPAPSLLPATLLQRAATRALSNPHVAQPALLYGPDPGYDPLRRALAAWLTSFYQPQRGKISHERIAITGGASQSLGNILSVYADPDYTRKIWIVAPAYFLSFGIFEDAGFGNFGNRNKMAAVPEDEEGLDIDYLRRHMLQSEEEARKEGKNSPVRASYLMAMCFTRHRFFECAITRKSSRIMSLNIDYQNINIMPNPIITCIKPSRECCP